MNKHMLFCIVVAGISSGFSQIYGSETDDTLTMAQCVNQEQIVAKRTGDFRIEYYMEETHLKMKTMSGFLSLNSASKPIFTQYRTQKISGWVLFFAGIGLIIADGKISRPSFPIITLGGITSSVTGIVVGYRSNRLFRLAIYTYNKNICSQK